MHRGGFSILIIAALVQCSIAGLNPFQILAFKYGDFLTNELPKSITHDLMGNPFSSLGEILDAKSIKSCTQHLLNYIQHPDLPSTPKCVKPKDLTSIQKALNAAKRLPNEIGPQCKDLLSGNLDELQKCKEASFEKGNKIIKVIFGALKNINNDCGNYIRQNKDKIRSYYKGGCKGRLDSTKQR